MSGSKVDTLGLKSRTSESLHPFILGISFEYLSFVYEFTVNKSPTLPVATWYLSKITRSFFDGIPTFAFLTILE